MRYKLRKQVADLFLNLSYMDFLPFNNAERLVFFTP